ncbi:patatin-like phospholipase family protein [Nostocoides sp. F2B08]|uniref:patatin-like phospholipase family protein n=1 Tax=Nostocoides sp. F2B08 TaxID=2653936 RepID=UPI001263DECE|nr:patatin-like phospholipase family protein [Tetrasphaera sp. F2B08]KAB7741020.1 patatin-like phospholipase family protein [Tetrasphaera sp. F2B08]
MRESGSTRRALVLGSGGHAGIAWEIGLILGLAEHGIDVTAADLLVGSSAGSVVASHLALGRDIHEALDRLDSPAVAATGTRMGPSVLARYLAASVRPGSRASGRAWLARRAERSAVIDEESFVAAVAQGIDDADWPDRDLMITAVRADTGQAVAFTRDSGVPLARAVAASCAVPLLYPPVTIHGDRYVDGGIRTVANADMAIGCDRVLVIAPVAFALRRSDRPRAQLASLGPRVRSTCIVPDEASLAAMGRNLLDPTCAPAAREAGTAQAAHVAGRVVEVWHEPVRTDG